MKIIFELNIKMMLNSSFLGEKSIFMKNKQNRLLYFLIFILLVVIVVPLLPHGDDWLFLNYFNFPEAWGINNGYRWINNCILLPRNFWRPFEDLLLKSETYLPWLYPTLNHILIVAIHVFCARVVYELAIEMKVKPKISLFFSLFFMFSTVSMGGILSIDSIAQVLVTFWGLLSVIAYLKHKYILWILFGFFTCFSKESGFVWFFVSPLFELLYNNRINNISIIKNLPFKKLMISIIPMAIYLTLYFYLNRRTIVNTVEYPSTVASGIENLMTISTSTNSHHLNVFVFIKNVFILYIAPIFPIDTSAIYYKEWILLAITCALSIFSFFGFIKIIYNYIKEKTSEFFLTICILICISSISLVTRAGEISPHPSMTILALLLAFCFNEAKIKSNKMIYVIAFCLSTIITDVHKYSLAYIAGRNAKEMAVNIKDNTKVIPNKVLLISVDDYSMRKAGAFIPVPGQDFHKGAAAIAEYGYQYPQRLDIKIFEKREASKLNNQIAKTISQYIKNYDCIWVQQGKNTYVVNNEHKQ